MRNASQFLEQRSFIVTSMTTKYYTRFCTMSVQLPAAVDVLEPCEWSGVVELKHPLRQETGPCELRTLLAERLEVASDDIRILHWARLH